MSYLKDFQAAVSRSKKLKIGEYKVQEEPFAIDQTILNTLEETGHIPFEQRAGNAMNVNFGMFHMLLKRFMIPNGIITMGNVSVSGEMRMDVAHTDFKKMIDDESGEENMGKYHLWTTLPGGYILDHVILSSLHHDGIISVNDAIPAERFLYGQADELPHGLQYHPMVVGLEFFVKSGTIDPEAMNYLMGERFAKQYD